MESFLGSQGHRFVPIVLVKEVSVLVDSDVFPPISSAGMLHFHIASYRRRSNSIDPHRQLFLFEFFCSRSLHLPCRLTEDWQGERRCGAVFNL